MPDGSKNQNFNKYTFIKNKGVAVAGEHS